MSKNSEVFIIKGDLPDLNNYTKANRGNKYAGNKLKQDATNIVCLYAKSQLRGKYERMSLSITYYCKNKRKDKDNIAFAKKFILDGLIKAGVIPDDGWGQIEGWTESFEVDKDDPRIRVELVRSV